MKISISEDRHLSSDMEIIFLCCLRCSISCIILHQEHNAKMFRHYRFDDLTLWDPDALRFPSSPPDDGSDVKPVRTPSFVSSNDSFVVRSPCLPHLLIWQMGRRWSFLLSRVIKKCQNYSFFYVTDYVSYTTNARFFMQKLGSSDNVFGYDKIGN